MENHATQSNGDSDVNKFVGAPRMSSMWSYPPRPYENYPHYRIHYSEPSPQQQQIMQPQYQQQAQQQYSQPQQFQQQASPQQQVHQQPQAAQSVQQIQHVTMPPAQQQILQKLPTPVQPQQQPAMTQVQLPSAQATVTTTATSVQASATVASSTTASESTTAPSPSVSTSNSAVGTLQNVLTSGHSQSQSSIKSSTSQLINSQQPVEQPTKMLTRNRLQDLVREVDPNEQLDEDVEDILLQIADDFVENAITNACLLAKHRKSNTVEVKDLQLHLERNWNMWIPGFGTDELRPFKKPSTTEAHKQRQGLVKKHMKKS